MVKAVWKYTNSQPMVTIKIESSEMMRVGENILPLAGRDGYQPDKCDDPFREGNRRKDF